MQLTETLAGVLPSSALMHDPLRLSQAHMEHSASDLDRLDRGEAFSAKLRKNRVPFVGQGVHSRIVRRCLSPRLGGIRDATSGGEQVSAAKRVGIVERIARQQLEVHHDRTIGV